jgi:hypothetical protein
MREQASDDAVLALHRVEVAVPVPPADCHAGDEVVEHEVVEDDHARSAAECIDDPGVRVGVVPDVVERHVTPAWRALAPVASCGDVEPCLESRQQQRAVVRDAGLPAASG